MVLSFCEKDPVFFPLTPLPHVFSSPSISSSSSAEGWAGACPRGPGQSLNPSSEAKRPQADRLPGFVGVPTIPGTALWLRAPSWQGCPGLRHPEGSILGARQPHPTSGFTLALRHHGLHGPKAAELARVVKFGRHRSTRHPTAAAALPLPWGPCSLVPPVLADLAAATLVLSIPWSWCSAERSCSWF